MDIDAMDTDENVNASATGSSGQARQPRRSRRIRDSVAQLGERIMRAGMIPGSARSMGASAGVQPENSTSPRLRHRVRFLSSRSASPRADVPVNTQRNGRPRSPVNTGIESGADIVHPNLHVRQSNDTHDHTMSGVTSTEEALTRSSQDAEVQTTNASSSVGGEASATPRRSRLSRVRSSLSSNLPNLLAELGNTSRFSANSSRRTSQLRNSQYDDPYDLEDDMDIDDHASLGSGEGSRNTRSGRNGFGSLDDANAMDLLENPRVRPGEDQAAMLSRLLSVAAAMTAASLVGNSEQALTEAQDVAGDTVDGSFESFLRALQNGRLAAALRNGGNEMGGGMSADNNTNDGAPPLNFFRMFRFGASATDSFNANNPPSEGDTPPSRMIPVIIVGIRSVSPRENTANTQAQDNNNAPFLEQLASSIPPLNGPSSSRSGLRNRLSSAANRRASMGSPAVDIPRLPRRARPVSDILSPTLTSMADTPQGPHPPPSTPAEPAVASTSAIENPVIPPNRAARTAHTDTPRPARRHSTPHLPANGARSEASSEGTNGRPGAAANGTGSERGARSWIIYVLGGSYPENHPILTTPSLFTDVGFFFSS